MPVLVASLLQITLCTTASDTVCMCITLTGHLRPLRPGRKDWSAIHLPQQSIKSVYKSSQGIQGNILARGDHTFLPTPAAQVGGRELVELR